MVRLYLFVIRLTKKVASSWERLLTGTGRKCGQTSDLERIVTRRLLCVGVTFKVKAVTK